MNSVEPGGATPLDPDEARGLIPSHITIQAELNEWEHANIVEGERWAFARRRKDLLTAEFLQRLHRKMFGATWRWAGHWRTTEKSIGIAPERISEAVRQLLLDVGTQLDAHSYPIRGSPRVCTTVSCRSIRFPTAMAAWPGRMRTCYCATMASSDSVGGRVIWSDRVTCAIDTLPRCVQLTIGTTDR